MANPSLHALAKKRQNKLEEQARSLLDNADIDFKLPGFDHDVQRHVKEQLAKLELTMDELTVVDGLVIRRWERLKNWFAVSAFIVSIISMAVTATMLVLRVREVTRAEIPATAQQSPTTP